MAERNAQEPSIQENEITSQPPASLMTLRKFTSFPQISGYFPEEKILVILLLPRMTMWIK